MIRRLVSRRTALIGAAGLAAAPAVVRAEPNARWAAVDAIARKAVAGKVTPGLQIAAMRGGAFVYSRGIGLSNLETGSPMTPNSVMRIGSASKLFVVTALLRLQEQGKLSLDDRLARFIPDFPRARDVTLRQLLTHTAGLGDYTHVEPPEKVIQQARLDYTSDALLAVVQEAKPLYIGEPDGQFAYSNSAYVLLGIVMERAGGRPLRELVRTLAVEPAGLQRSAIDDSAEVVPGRASGYAPDPKAPSGFDNASYFSISYAAAAGGARSTAEEFCRMERAVFKGGLLRPESAKAMRTAVQLKNGKPALVSGGPPLAPPEMMGWGLGMYVADDAHGPLITHRGGVQGFVTFASSRPEADTRFAIITNAESGQSLGAVFAQLRDAIGAALLA